FDLSPDAYGLNQLRYDLRKLKGHALLERDGGRYAYHLTSKGVQVALLFLFFHKRLCDRLPTADSTTRRTPDIGRTAASNSPTTAPTGPSKTSSTSSPPPDLRPASPHQAPRTVCITRRLSGASPRVSLLPENRETRSLSNSAARLNLDISVAD